MSHRVALYWRAHRSTRCVMDVGTTRLRCVHIPRSPKQRAPVWFLTRIVLVMARCTVPLVGYYTVALAARRMERSEWVSFVGTGSSAVSALSARTAVVHQSASTVVSALCARTAVVHQSASTAVSALSARSAVGLESASTVVGATTARSAAGLESASTVVGALTARSAVGPKSASTAVGATGARSARNSSTHPQRYQRHVHPLRRLRRVPFLHSHPPHPSSNLLSRVTPMLGSARSLAHCHAVIQLHAAARRS